MTLNLEIFDITVDVHSNELIFISFKCNFGKYIKNRKELCSTTKDKFSSIKTTDDLKKYIEESCLKNLVKVYSLESKVLMFNEYLKKNKTKFVFNVEALCVVEVL